jgi:uncharacterized membrane protein
LQAKVGDSYISEEMPTPSKERLGYLDWLRGLACVLMFQTHTYDAWLSPTARKSTFFGWSQFVGSLPAPLFLFFAGISFALVTDKLRRRGIAPNEIAKKTIRRGAEILALAFLFRLQEFLLGFANAHWTDLFRVDILNAIGVSLMMMGVLCRFVSGRAATTWAAAGAAWGIAALTPPLWTTWRPWWLPWILQSYIDGFHNNGAPQHGLFPIFPWSAFAFAGLAVGFVLVSDWAKANTTKLFLAMPAAGVAVFGFSKFLDSRPQFYKVYDYWHTSPNFFLARVGVLLLITFFGYAWCRWGAGEWGFSPLSQMGQTSLLVYWVHIEFVYGGLSIMGRQAQSVRSASIGLLVITVMMVLLSLARMSPKESATEALDWLLRGLRLRHTPDSLGTGD